MTDPQLTLADLAAEEEELRLAGFTHDDVGAWAARWSTPRAGRCAGSRSPGRPAAVPPRCQQRTATRVDRAQDARRRRIGHSSLYMGQARDAGSTVEEMFGLDRGSSQRTAARSILVRSVGPVGVVVVSGLPQVEDHRMVVAALRAHLARG